MTRLTELFQAAKDIPTPMRWSDVEEARPFAERSFGQPDLLRPRERWLAATVSVALFVGVVLIAFEPFSAGPEVGDAPPSNAAKQFSFGSLEGWSWRTSYESSTPGPVIEVANYPLWEGTDATTTNFYGRVAPSIPEDGIAIRLQQLVGVCGCADVETGSFPPSITETDVDAWGQRAFATSAFSAENSYLLLDVEFGAQPSRDQLRLTNEALEQIEMGGETLPSQNRAPLEAPRIQASDVNTVSSTSVGASLTWASSVPFEARDLVELNRDPTYFRPEATMRGLPPDGYIIVASVNGTSDGTFPAATLPLRLTDARVDHTWETQPAPDIPQYLIWAEVAGLNVDVRTFFGTENPSDSVLGSAQETLSTLTFDQNQ